MSFGQQGTNGGVVVDPADVRYEAGTPEQPGQPPRRAEYRQVSTGDLVAWVNPAGSETGVLPSGHFETYAGDDADYTTVEVEQA